MSKAWTKSQLSAWLGKISLDRLCNIRLQGTGMSNAPHPSYCTEKQNLNTDNHKPSHFVISSHQIKPPIVQFEAVLQLFSVVLWYSLVIWTCLWSVCIVTLKSHSLGSSHITNFSFLTSSVFPLVTLTSFTASYFEECNKRGSRGLSEEASAMIHQCRSSFWHLQHLKGSLILWNVSWVTSSLLVILASSAGSGGIKWHVFIWYLSVSSHFDCLPSVSRLCYRWSRATWSL